MQRERQHRREAVLWLALLGITILILSLFIKPIGRGTVTSSTFSPKQTIDSDSLPTLQYQNFDPNEADYATMVAAGVPRNIAVNLIRWREAGKVFRIKLYFVLEPYIIIGEKYRIKPKHSSYTSPQYSVKDDTEEIAYSAFRIDTATAKYLRTIGFSTRQAELIIRYGNMIGGYRNIEEFEECYAVDSAMAARLPVGSPTMAKST